MITLKPTDLLCLKITSHLWSGYLDIMQEFQVSTDNDPYAADAFFDNPDNDVDYYYNAKLRKYSGSYIDGQIQFANDAGLTHFLLAHNL